MVATTPPIVETSPSGSRSRSGSSEGHSVLVSSLNTGTLGSAPRGPSSQVGPSDQKPGGFHILQGIYKILCHLSKREGDCLPVVGFLLVSFIK